MTLNILQAHKSTGFKVWFTFFVEWQINIRELSNAKAIPIEQQNGSI